MLVVWAFSISQTALRLPGALVIGERESYDTYASDPTSSRYGTWFGAGPFLGLSSLTGQDVSDATDNYSMGVFALPSIPLVERSGLQTIINGE